MKPVLSLFQYKVPRMVEVWWTDAYLQNRWHDREVTERHRSAVKTIGYLAGQDERFITLVQSIGGDASEDDHDDGAALHIPRGMVVKMRTLR